MVELYLIRYFIAVIEAGGFTKAASSLNITQPTLSAGIRKLEEGLGVTLFERTGRRVFLTPAGSRFLLRAREIMQLCNMAVREAADAEQPAVARLGVLVTIPAALAARLVTAVQRSPTALPLELVEGTEQELANRLKDGSLDFALTLDRGENAGLAVSRPYEEGYALALCARHPLAGAATLSAEDVMHEPMIVRQRCEVLSETSRHFTDRNVRPRFTFRSPNDERVLELVGAGLGMTVMPDSYTHPNVARVPMTGFNYRRCIVLQRSPAATGLSDADHVQPLVDAVDAVLGERLVKGL